MKKTSKVPSMGIQDPNTLEKKSVSIGTKKNDSVNVESLEKKSIKVGK